MTLATAEARWKVDQTQLGVIWDHLQLSGYAATILAFACYIAGKLTEGIQMAQHAMELDPESFLAPLSLAFALHCQGRYAEALAATEAGLAMPGRHPMFMAELAATYADWGRHTEAKSVHAEMLARSERQYVSPFLLALSAAAAGEGADARRFARLAYEIRDPQLPVFGKHWPGTKRLREDAGFAFPASKDACPVTRQSGVSSLLLGLD